MINSESYSHLLECQLSQEQNQLGEENVAESILRTLLSEATDCIAVKDLQGKYLLINRPGEEFLGKNRSEIIGKTDFDLFARDTALQIRETDRVVMESGKTQIVEDLLVSLSGKKRYFQAMKCAYKSPTGEAQGVISIIRDITVKKQAQLALEQSNKELEQFATFISHDLQGPIRKINIFTESLLTHAEPLTTESQDYLKRIQRTATKMTELVTSLLAFSRVNRTGLVSKKVNLRELTEEVILELAFEIESAEALIENAVTDIALEANPTQVRQLLDNLLRNALKFRKKDVTPVITISSSLVNTMRCELVVEDNGIGFDDEHKRLIFEVFERLHSVKEYPGSGIGLAICKKIVDRHGGEITVESEPGIGSKFMIQLPLKP